MARRVMDPTTDEMQEIYQDWATIMSEMDDD